MPSQYTSGQSYDDSKALIENLGVRMAVLAIKPAFDTYLDTLAEEFDGAEPDATEENLQARIRGNLLMAASNKFGWIVLTTGNKSEMATGYATLYGDMAGGFAVIKDVPKTLVQQLSRHRNVMAGREVIPESIIVRPPTAELRPDQKRRGFAASVRPARPHPGGVRGGGLQRGGDAGVRAAARCGGVDGASGGPQRVQAQAGTARSEGNAA